MTHRELAIANLIFAFRLGLYRDPRWWEAARRLWPFFTEEDLGPIEGTVLTVLDPAAVKSPQPSYREGGAGDGGIGGTWGTTRTV